MGDWLDRVDELLLILLFVVIPILQRIGSSVAQRRRESVAKERARRRRDGMHAPMALEDEDTGEPEVAPPSKLTQLLETFGDREEQEQELVEEFITDEPEFDALAGPAPIEQHATVASAPLEGLQPLASVGLALQGLPSEAGLGSLSDPASLSSLSDIDFLEAGEALSDFQYSNLDELRQPPDLAAPAGASPGTVRGPVDWRRAVIHAEILASPVCLRGPGGGAPGLDS